MTRDIRDYINPAELQAFYQRDPWPYLRDGIAIWAVILGSLAGAILSHNLWVNVVAFVLIAGRQHALNNMVHEASHFLLARDKRLNDLVSDLLFAAPHLITTAGYRGKHLAHHVHLGHPPEDAEFKARYLFRRSRAIWRSLWVLLGGSSLMTAAAYGRETSSEMLPRVFILATNGMLLAFCWSLGSPWAYAYLWLLPLFTLTGYFATLRVVAEHQPLSYAKLPEEDFNSPFEPAITRSIPAGPVARFFLAPLNFCYHFEHHAFPAIPYPSLPRLHRTLEERGYFRDHPELRGAGYGSVLWSLITSDIAVADPHHHE